MAILLFTKTPSDHEGVTQVKNFYSQYLEENEVISTCAAMLSQDNVLALPSDSVYGLMLRYSSANAERLHEMRRRPLDKPFLLAMTNKVDYGNLVGHLDAEKAEAIHQYWPGKNTLVLPKKNSLEYPPGETIALRQIDQSNLLFYQVLHQLAEPVLAPSLNLPGQEPLFAIEDIIEQFGSDLDGILFDSNFVAGEPSNIYDLTGDEVQKLR